MLCTSLDLYQTLTRHITTVDLKHTNKIRLTKLARLTDSSDIFTYMKILFYFLFHINTPSGLNLVHLGLFYSLFMI